MDPVRNFPAITAIWLIESMVLFLMNSSETSLQSCQFNLYFFERNQNTLIQFIDTLLENVKLEKDQAVFNEFLSTLIEVTFAVWSFIKVTQTTPFMDEQLSSDSFSLGMMKSELDDSHKVRNYFEEENQIFLKIASQILEQIGSKLASNFPEIFIETGKHKSKSKISFWNLLFPATFSNQPSLAPLTSFPFFHILLQPSFDLQILRNQPSWLESVIYQIIEALEAERNIPNTFTTNQIPAIEAFFKKELQLLSPNDIQVDQKLLTNFQIQAPDLFKLFLVWSTKIL